MTDVNDVTNWFRRQDEEQERPSPLQGDNPLTVGAFAETRTPDQAANDINTAHAVGQPPAAVQAYRDVFERAAEAARVRNSTAETPRLREWFGQADNHAVAHDDVDTLASVERHARNLAVANPAVTGVREWYINTNEYFRERPWLRPFRGILRGALRGGEAVAGAYDSLSLSRAYGQEQLEVGDLERRRQQSRDGFDVVPLTPEEERRIENFQRTNRPDHPIWGVNQTVEMAPLMIGAVGNAYNEIVNGQAPAGRVTSNTPSPADRGQSFEDYLREAVPRAFGNIQTGVNRIVSGEGVDVAQDVGTFTARGAYAVGGDIPGSGLFTTIWDQEAVGVYEEAMRQGIAAGVSEEEMHRHASDAAEVTGLLNTMLEGVGDATIAKVSGLGELGERAGLTEARNLIRRQTLDLALRRAGIAALSSGAANAVEESAQEVGAMVGEADARDRAGIAAPADATMEHAVSRMIESGVAGFEGGLGMGAPGTIGNLYFNLRDLRNAQNEQAWFAQMVSAAQNSKLVARSPAAAEGAVNAMLADSPAAQVQISVEALDELAQQGVERNVLLNQLGVSAQEVQQARDTSGFINVSAGRYFAQVAPTQANAQIQRHMRLTPESYTQVEIERAQKEMQDTMSALAAEVETAQSDEEIGQAVEQRIRDLATNAGGFRPEVASQYAKLAAALPRALLARARAADPAYAAELEPKLRRLFGEGINMVGAAQTVEAGAGSVEYDQRAKGPDAGPVRNERWNPPEGVRITERMRKIGEMAANGASNEWIAEEMSDGDKIVTADNIAVTLSQLKSKLGGNAPWEAGETGNRPGLNTQTGEDVVPIEALLKARNQMREAGYPEGRGRRGSINSRLAERFGMSVNRVGARFREYEEQQRAAGAPLPAPAPSKRRSQIFDLATTEARQEWFEEPGNVIAAPIPGEALDSRSYGFALDNGYVVTVDVAPEPGGATTISWTFLHRTLAGGEPFADGHEHLTVREKGQLLSRLQAVIEADMAEFERDAYVWTPESEGRMRANRAMVARAEGTWPYTLLRRGSDDYLVRHGVDVTLNGAIFNGSEKQGEWDPDQDPASIEARKAKFNERLLAELGSADGTSETGRRSDNPGRGGVEPSGRSAGTGGTGELYQSQPAFYSVVERVVSESKTARAPGAQWLATISKAPGVKKEELDWIGLPDFLQAQEGPISREDVLAFVRENGVTVEETVLGAPSLASGVPSQEERLALIEERDRLGAEMYDLEQDYRGQAFSALPDDVQARIEEISARSEVLDTQIAAFEDVMRGRDRKATRWSSYTLPGGERYRELLLRLPASPREPALYVPVYRNGQWEITRNEDNGVSGSSNADWTTREQAQAAADRENKKFPRDRLNSADFKSSHWNQPNVLAHVRFNERVDADGKKTLFVEEVQSDWHQKGREQGYKDDAESNRIHKKLIDGGVSQEEIDDLLFQRRGMWNDADTVARIREILTPEELAAFRAETGTMKVPDAPFKNNAWAALTMKRMIRWASENGFDKVAWIQGQHAVDRFSLETHAESLDWTKEENGTYTVALHGKNGSPGATISRQTPEQLASSIGKELTDKILAGKGQQGKTGGRTHGIIRGLDLKVGGEGMKAFYDRILPNIANDIGKKFGAKAGQTSIDASAPYQAYISGSRWLVGDIRRGGGSRVSGTPEFKTQEAAQDWIATTYGDTVVHSLPVTPEMREAAMQGLPLFQRTVGEGKRGSIVFNPAEFQNGEVGDVLIKMGSASDLSTFLHEFGHLAHITLESLSGAENAPAEFKSMWTNTLDWWGVSQEEWSAMDMVQREPYYERWARTFEAYLMEGKAPSLSLREAFAAFKSWLTQIYRSVFALDHNFNPQIRDVFDRLLASDAELAEARASMGADFKLDRANFPAMTDEEWAQMQAAAKEAREAEDAELRARVMDAYVRKEKRWWRTERNRVRPTAEADVDAEPARQAYEWLAFGEKRPEITEHDDEGNEMIRASTLPDDLPKMTLDANALRAEYGDDIFNELPVGLRPARPEDVDAVLEDAMVLKRERKGKVPALRLGAWVKKQGGIKDTGGEIRQAIGSGRARPGIINNETGLDPDDLALRAQEAGYFGATIKRELLQRAFVIDTDRGPITVDPSNSEMLRLTRPRMGQPKTQTDSLRYILSSSGRMFVANAFDMTHDDIARAVRARGIDDLVGYEMHAGDTYSHGIPTGFIRRAGDDKLAGVPARVAELSQGERPDAGRSADGQRVVYRGLNKPYDPNNGGYYQSFTSSADDAREYGSHVMAARIKPGRNLAIDGGGNNFNALSVEQLPSDVRAKLHPSIGSSATTDQIAHAAREAGYDSVTVRNVHDNRWGERPARGQEPRTIDFVFDTRNITPIDGPIPQAQAAADAGKVRLSDADRALLAELEDLPDAARPDAGSAAQGQSGLPLGERVIRNPSGEQLIGLLNRADGHLRAVFDDSGMYVFDARNLIHKQGAEAAGIPYNSANRGDIRLVDGLPEISLPEEVMWTPEFANHKGLSRYLRDRNVLFNSGSEGLMTGPEYARHLGVSPSPNAPAVGADENGNFELFQEGMSYDRRNGSMGGEAGNGAQNPQGFETNGANGAASNYGPDVAGGAYRPGLGNLPLDPSSPWRGEAPKASRANGRAESLAEARASRKEALSSMLADTTPVFETQDEATTTEYNHPLTGWHEGAEPVEMRVISFSLKPPVRADASWSEAFDPDTTHVWFEVGPDWAMLRAANSSPRLRGSGAGTQMHLDAIDALHAIGKRVFSDSSMSEDALRVWREVLPRFGYTVVPVSEATYSESTKQWNTPDGLAQYEVLPRRGAPTLAGVMKRVNLPAPFIGAADVIVNPARGQIESIIAAQEAKGETPSVRWGVDELGRLLVWDGKKTSHAMLAEGMSGQFKQTGEIENALEIDSVLSTSARSQKGYTPQQVMDALGVSEETARGLLQLHGKLSMAAAPVSATPDVALFQDAPDPTRRVTVRELIDALVADLKNERPVYSANDEEALAAYNARTDMERWFAKRDIDLSGSKAEIRAQIEAALNREAENPNGVDPDIAASWFGFTSGDEMIQALKGLKPREQAIEERIDQILEATHGDPMKDGTVAEEARQAAHNEAQAHAIELDLMAIEKANGGRSRPVGKAARAYAKAQILNMTVKQIRSYDSFLAAERRAARNTLDAVKKKDYVTARVQKQRQLVSFWLYKLGREAAEEMDKTQAYFAKFDRDGTRQAFLPNGGRHLEQIDQVLEAVDLRKTPFLSQRRRDSFNEYLAKLQDEGIDTDDIVELDPAFLEAVRRRPFNTLTLQEVRGLRDVVKNFETLGRRWNQVLTDRKHRRLNDVITGLVDRAQEEYPKRAAIVPSLASRSKFERAVDMVMDLHGSMVKIEQMMRFMDGLKANGPWFSTFIPAAQRAESAKSDRMEAETERFSQMLSVYSKKELGRMLLKKIHIAAIGDSLTKMQMIGVALNAGNEYNREGLMKGFQWNEQQLRAVLDQLDQRDARFVQDVWDFLGSFKAESFALDERVRGVRPEEVAPSPVNIAGLDLPGGYFPVKYDPDHPNNTRAAKQQAKEAVEQLSGGSYRQVGTKRGRLKQRVGTAGMAFRLDPISIISEHVEETVHDLTHREFVIDARRLIASRRVRDSIRSVVGRFGVKALDAWIAKIEQPSPRVATTWDSLAGKIRNNATIVNMGWKISTALIQELGTLNVIPRTGILPILKQKGITVARDYPVFLARQTARLFGAPETLPARIQFILDRSAFMKQRMENRDRDVRDAMASRLGERPGILPQVPKKVHDSMLALSGLMDMGVSVPAWLAGYESALGGKVKGIAQGDEQAAIEYADSIIRTTQSGGAPKDLAQILASDNQFWRLATMFFSWSSTFYNQLFVEQIPGVMAGKVPVTRFTANMLFIWFLPALATMWFYGRLEPQDGEDDDDFVKRAAAETVLYPLQTIPIIRDGVNSYLTHYDYQFSPAQAAMEAPLKLVQAAESGNQEAMAKQALMSAGYMMGWPSRQMWITGEGVTDIATGEDDLSDPLDTLRELTVRDTR